MLVQELKLENIRCFARATLDFRRGGEVARWVTLLSENGGGKSTVLQALALLLAGPESAPNLFFRRPNGWLRDDERPGKMLIHLRKGPRDSGTHPRENGTTRFTYHVNLTGSKPLTVRKHTSSDPSILPGGTNDERWLREHAFGSKAKGWFAAGYGAFRRGVGDLHFQIMPEEASRFLNFFSLFVEDQPLTSLERWLPALHYQSLSLKSPESRRLLERSTKAIDSLLPDGTRFERIDPARGILYSCNGREVSTISMSDGYRSIFALAGDLVWRLFLAFPNSDDPMKEEGVVLIDELDIHLHPRWQRDIAGRLRQQFPNLQFIVATHSPLVAAGAGADALTLRFRNDQNGTVVEPVEELAAMNVDRILESAAFGLDSPYSPETQQKIERYEELTTRDGSRTGEEEAEYKELRKFMARARPIGGPPEPGSLQARIEAYLDHKLK